MLNEGFWDVTTLLPKIICRAALRKKKISKGTNLKGKEKNSKGICKSMQDFLWKRNVMFSPFLCKTKSVAQELCKEVGSNLQPIGWVALPPKLSSCFWELSNLEFW